MLLSLSLRVVISVASILVGRLCDSIFRVDKTSTSLALISSLVERSQYK